MKLSDLRVRAVAGQDPSLRRLGLVHAVTLEVDPDLALDRTHGPTPDPDRHFHAPELFPALDLVLDLGPDRVPESTGPVRHLLSDDTATTDSQTIAAERMTTL